MQQQDTMKKRGGNARNRRTTFPQKKARKMQADERQGDYNKLTTSEKMAKLDATLGVNVGAKKQRTKLQKQMASEKKS